MIAICTTLLDAKVDVTVQQLQNDNIYILDSGDIVFSEDFIRFQCSSNIGEKFTLTYQI